MKQFCIWFFSLLAPIVSMAQTQEYVDLGLTSKTLWATTNIGASSPEEFGDYFSWGEITTKSTYSWSNYTYSSGTSSTVQDIGSVISGTSYDVARAKWGSDWQMPTIEQVEELIDECDLYIHTSNGVKGILFTGPNGNSIFLPCPGYKYDSSTSSVNQLTYYWSGTKDTSGGVDYKASTMFIRISSNSVVESATAQRRTGLPVRPVRAAGGNISEETTSTPEAVDLGLSVKWATYNVGASSPEKTGSYYAWGETSTKTSFTWANYQYASGSASTVKDIGDDISATSYDVATKEWGSDWRMPSKAELAELYEKCTFTATTVSGVSGYTVTGPSGKSIFLPLCGCSYDGKNYGNGSYAYYSSGDISASSNQKIYSLYIKSATKPTTSEVQRRTGIVIRPVKGAKEEIEDPVTPTTSKMELVDLGLSVKWANMNVDASNVTEAGGFYAWGETAVKSTYKWTNYTYCTGTAASSVNIGTNISQNSTYDVAFLRDNSMCLPTMEQWNELINKCTWKEETNNGVKGYRVTATNGNSIFLPYAGCSYDGKDYGVGTYSYYWSSNNLSSDVSKAQAVYLKTSNSITTANLNRRTGVAVRPVEAVDEPIVTPSHSWDIEAVDLGLSVSWCNANIGGNKIENEEYSVDFFAWGETATKNTYTWANYAHSNGSASSVKDIGSNISNTSYDAASATSWGQTGSWRMPTINEMNELLTKCTFTEGVDHGVSGYYVTGPNGNSIFLPFVGCSYDGKKYGQESYTYLWTSGIDPTDSQKARVLYIKSNTSPTMTSCRRRTGIAIRPVMDKATPVSQIAPYVIASGTTLTFYYDDKASSRTGTKYDLNTGTHFPEWYLDGTSEKITTVVFDTSFYEARPTTCYAWFLMMSKLTNITGISYLNTSEVTDMEGMFAYCASLTSLDVSHFDTSNVTNMNTMFALCYKLSNLDVSEFNTVNVTDMGCMFLSCSTLRSLDLSSFETSKVKNMGSMFQDCTNLTTLDISSFDTSNVTFISTMFMDCTSLRILDLSSFTFNSNISSLRMLSNCSALTQLSIPSSANYLDDNACTKIGTSTKPCLLIYPNNFTPTTTTSSTNYYVWKNGYFYDNHEDDQSGDDNQGDDNQGGNDSQGGSTTDTNADFVDLGLPSGKLWASHNVGASSPEIAGNYYAWGEIATKSSYTWNNYVWDIDTSDSDATLIGTDEIGGIPTIDPSCGETVVYNNTTYLSRMPSYDDILELFKNCTRNEEKLNGVTGYRITGTNGNSIFLPLVGCYYDSYTPSKGASSGSYYWTSTLSASDDNRAWALSLKGAGAASLSQNQRRTGQPIRAIYYPNGSVQPKLGPAVTDGIHHVQKSYIDDESIHTLQGIKVEGTLRPGIYIQRGRKFIVR